MPQPSWFTVHTHPVTSRPPVCWWHLYRHQRRTIALTRSKGPGQACGRLSARPGCALPWAGAGGVGGFRGGLHRPQGGAHVGPQLVPPGGDDLGGLAWRVRSGCPQVAGAGPVGETLPDRAAAAGEWVDPVPPRRGRAGGVTAVIQDHPREHPGPVRLGDHAGHLVFEAIQEPVVPGEPSAGLRAAGFGEPGRPDTFRAPPADPGDVRNQVPHQLRPGGDHLLGDRRQPGHLAGDLAAVGAWALGHVFLQACRESVLAREFWRGRAVVADGGRATARRREPAAWLGAGARGRRPACRSSRGRCGRPYYLTAGLPAAAEARPGHGASFPAWPVSSRRTEIRQSPRSRTLVSSPCSAAWSATSPQMTVWSPWPLICRPSNQAAHRLSRTPATRISYRTGPSQALTRAPATARPERHKMPCPAVRIAAAAKPRSLRAVHGRA